MASDEPLKWCTCRHPEHMHTTTDRKCCVDKCACRKYVHDGRKPLSIAQEELRKRIGALFIVADEGERKGEFWWVCYMAGVRCFASTKEDEVDNFRNRLHQSVLETLGLR